jgi:trk system potassium uptake protein TrkA
MGVPVIISRANDVVHQRILQLVGAHQIVNPEQEFGKRFANRLLYKHVITDTNIGESLHLTEILVQPTMIGKTLVDLALPKRFGVVVVGIRRGIEGKIHQPTPASPLLADDHLIIVSRESAIAELIKGVKA